MGENIVTEKMKKPVYTDYPDYRDEPFSTSKKFGVYIPKMNDQVSDLISRHEAKSMLRNKSCAPKRSENIFESQNVGADQVVPANNMFANSMRTNGCNDCNPEQQRDCDHNQRVQTEEGCSNWCPCCQNYSKCCCRSRNNFRIRRPASKCDSAYSHDTNTMKTKLHGHRYGYYTNQPYTTIGSDFLGSRFYKDHPGLKEVRAPLLSKPCSKANTARKFESNLMTDARTGELLNQRSMNPVMRSLLRDSRSIRNNREVQEGIMRLKETGCLNVPCQRIKKNNATQEKGYVYNDYHLKQSRGGYSRTDNGGRSYV